MAKLSLAILVLAVLFLLETVPVSEAGRSLLRKRMVAVESKLVVLEQVLKNLEQRHHMDMHSKTAFCLDLLSRTNEQQKAIDYIMKVLEDMNQGWLGKECTNTSQCNGGLNTTCYQGKCNCVPGLYYSVSGNKCIKGWLGKECTNTSQCNGGLNTTCYQGKCNCVPGLYYSVSGNKCIKDCALSDLGTGFTFYYKGNIISSVLGLKIVKDVQDCFKYCMQFSNCRSIDYRPGDKHCFPMEYTAQERTWSPITRPLEHDHYQRYCA